MNGFFDTVLSLVLTTKENRRYQELQQKPEEAARSTRFGKKFIANATAAIILAVLALAFSGIALAIRQRETDIGFGLFFILYLVCIAISILLALYAIILLLTRLKYVRWQRNLNTLPIGKTARLISFIALAAVIILDAVAIVLIITSVG